MRQPIVKDLRSKAKDFIKCPRGASRPWPRGLDTHTVKINLEAGCKGSVNISVLAA